MKLKLIVMKTRSILFLLFGLIIAALPVQSEAQFLKKLSKGLEKINKGLEQVSGVTNQTTQSSDNKSSAVPDQSAPKLNENGWKKVENTYNQPFLTPETRFLKAPYNNVSNVSDGVFAINRMGKYEFWKVDGTKLYGAEWEGVGEDTYKAPMFVGGVAPAKRAVSNGRICLLYLDGHIKECDPSWEKVSQFCDGLAIVEAEINHKKVWFFINSVGKKVFPTLTVYANRYGSLAARPLKNGLRAFPSRSTDGKFNEVWGYIDESGNVKIAPKYKQAHDFSGGYALVELDGTMQFIDTTGKVVWNTGEQSYTKISDACDGIVYIEHGPKVDYYDVTGKRLASFAEGNAFYDGKAFVKENGKENVTLINTKFEPLRSVYWKILPPSDVTQFKPVFEPYGLATVNAKSVILNPEGNVAVESYDDHKGTQIHGFSQFAASGYALCNAEINGALCSALMKPSGEIVWLFSDDESAAGPYPPGKVPPVKPRPLPIYPTPIPPIEPGFTLIIVKWDMPPVGPTTVQPVKYKVGVAAEPAEGGIVNLTPTGTFGYGDYATVTASANDGWAVGYVTTTADVPAAPQVGKPFSVTADQTVTVHFIKKDIDEKPTNIGAFQGEISMGLDDEELYKIPVYLQVSDNEATPYGENTYGYMALMFDPSTRYTDKKHTFAVSLFAAPLKVCGVQTDASTGKKWLVLDGGSVSANDMRMSPAGGDVYGMLMNMMIGFDGFSSINTKPRHYRVEMCDIDDKTGEFTAGLLETFLPEAGGWVSGDDKRLHDTRTGMFGSVTDKGYPADCLLNVRFKKSAPRTDVQWYPPESWSQNQNAYQQLIEAMGAAYRTAKSDYYNLFNQ